MSPKACSSPKMAFDFCRERGTAGASLDTTVPELIAREGSGS